MENGAYGAKLFSLFFFYFAFSPFLVILFYRMLQQERTMERGIFLDLLLYKANLGEKKPLRNCSSAWISAQLAHVDLHAVSLLSAVIQMFFLPFNLAVVALKY